jgi:predicted metal-binding membrane protein
VHNAPSSSAASGRDRFLILVALGLTVSLSWAYLAGLTTHLSSSMHDDALMAAMGMATAWTATDVLFVFVMWTVMMIGMMGPSAAPVFLLFAASRRGQTLTVLMFGLGYLAMWTGFSAIATLAQWMLQRAALLSPDMAAATPYLAGAILIAAGVYQLTPFKAACLTHCRSPLGFLMTSWRDGWWGAVRMGARHGAYCVGCCWALMGVLFAVGVMNLAWVGVLTAFLLIEKIGPGGGIAARIGGAVLIGAGILTLAQ